MEFGNEVANLAQQIHFRSRWNVVVFIFHPCRVAGLNKSFQLFLKPCGMRVKYCHKFNGQGPMGYWLREINMLVHGLGT